MGVLRVRPREPQLATNRFANLDINPNPGTTGITSPEFSLRYWGMYGDKESKLLYNGRRSYRPEDGVYTQNDPVGLGGGLNRRAGLDGNPLGNSDPTGLSPCRWIGPVLQCNWGPPPSIDPENPYSQAGSPSLGWQVPSYGIPSAIMGACKSITDWMLSQGTNGTKSPPVLGATPGDPTKGRTTQWEKDGGMDEANRDFDGKNPGDVTSLPDGGRRGTLPDAGRLMCDPKALMVVQHLRFKAERTAIK
jgi:RHS repeat-associated protein